MASITQNAHIEVKLFVAQIPKIWEDRDVFFYFKRFANIIEARIIRDFSKQGSINSKKNTDIKNS